MPSNVVHKFRTGLVLIVITALVACSPEPETADFSLAERPAAPADSEWRHYLKDGASSQWSSLDQVHRGNVAQLREAWRFNTGGAAANGSSQMPCNPLIIRAILYCVSPEQDVVALNAANGDLLWRFRSAATSVRFFSPTRGLAYWEGENSRRLYFTADAYLYALDASTGKKVPTFGDGGRVDLREGLPEWAADADVIASSPGVVYRDLLIIGSRVSEFKGAAPGHVRAFDVRSGELKWVFRTIPEAGEFGAETWPAQALPRAGGVNNWAGITIDRERGIAYLPIGSPTFDFYGGDRAGDNLFGNSLVAVDAATGKRLWHYQTVRHDLWDRDLPSPPNLIDINRDGRVIAAVVQATKTGHLFVFNRETGEPLFTVREEPVVGQPLPGEVPATSQPLPDWPQAFVQSFKPSDRSPAIAKAVNSRLAALDDYALYRVPGTRGAVLFPGVDGGAEWGGAAYDAGRQRLFINANEVPYLLQVVPMASEQMGPESAYLMMCAPCHGVDLRGDGISVPALHNVGERLNPREVWQVVSHGRGRMPAFRQLNALEKSAVLWHIYFGDHEARVGHRQQSAVATGAASYLNAGYMKLLDTEGLPASRPPWGSLNAVDMQTGEIAWRVPLGDYPEVLAAGKQGLGAENYGGPVATAGGLVFIAATPDSRFRAFDSDTGEVLWEAELPVPAFATPAVYAVDGRQYLVVAAGGGKLGQDSGSEIIAYALPAVAKKLNEAR